MDPFTFGIVFVGTTGASLAGIALLEGAGLKINGTALRLFMETAKYGTIFYLLKMLSKMFLWFQSFLDGTDEKEIYRVYLLQSKRTFQTKL